MSGIINFLPFLMACVLLALTPGSDTMYILGRSIAGGRRTGTISVLGTASGLVIHTLLAAFGLSVLIQQSEVAFMVIKYAGAMYLIYLGVRSILSRQRQVLEPSAQVPYRAHRVYWSGMATNILNPKISLFFLAFLPQFIAPGYDHPLVGLLILGLTFTIIGSAWGMVIAWFSATLSRHFRQNPRIKVWLDRVSGGLFIALGGKLALTE